MPAVKLPQDHNHATIPDAGPSPETGTSVRHAHPHGRRPHSHRPGQAAITPEKPGDWSR